MQREEMRDVAMVVAYVVAILRPLLQLSPRPDLRLQQFVAQLGDLRPVVGIDIERGGGLDVVREQVPDDFLIVGDARFLGAMLRATSRPA